VEIEVDAIVGAGTRVLGGGSEAVDLGETES